MKEENAVMTLKWVLETLEERSAEANSALEENREDAFAAGRALAFVEALEIVKNRMFIFESLE